MAGNFIYRCDWHDYHSRCIYLITILKAEGWPRFCEIYQDPKKSKVAPVINYSPLGDLIMQMIMDIPMYEPKAKILIPCVMPDHIHFEIFIRERTKRHLGHIINGFKAGCTSKANKLLRKNGQCPFTGSVFMEGFNDKIVFRAGMKDKFYS